MKPGGLILTFVLSALTWPVVGQNNYVNVIPPSPTASAMQQYGNTNVGLYTGAVNVSIPIHTIKLKELNFPIALNYSGSGGINIQQVASWVGIGWTLNATGAVSRTIYGLADDKYSTGYLSLPAIPPPTSENQDTFLDFSSGMRDGEPDKYFYSANGVSGSFYINKQKQVVQVPLTHNKIIPEFDYAGKIIAFDLVTDSGIVYRFSEHEESRSYIPGGTSTDNNYYVSSWYLASVHNYNNTEAIYFHYEAYSFNQTAEVYSTRIIENSGSIFWPRYSITETNAKRLKYITYNQTDTIEFIPGNLSRRDLTGEKFLATIEIKERKKIRSVDFSYSYFDNNGVVPITSTNSCSGAYAEISLIDGQTDGDNCKRLKLDSVMFFNENRTESLPYTFEYYSQEYLPHRFSYARDHWGFYNGQNNNPGLEPRRKVDRRPIASYLRGSDFAIYGNANREPSAAHAKAGVLTKIIYPTGGSTIYEYELHQSSLELLPNQKQPFGVSLSPVTKKDTIHLETISDPFVDVKVSVMGLILSSEHCDFTVTFKNLQTSTITTLADFYEHAGSRTIFLEEGDYEISYVAHNGTSTCFEDFYALGFQWENELPTPVKNVGGLRIKKTIDVSGTGDSIKRVYNYTLQNSTLSSGSLVSVPRYGYYEAGYAQSQIIGFYRMYNTNTPLALTQGSHVGYKRIEVTTAEPHKTGKSVYYYTCPADFPDFTRGWTSTKYDDEVILNTEYTYIFPHHDNRDWKRGVLYAQVNFEFQNDQFVRISGKENHYKVYAEVENAFDLNWQSKYPVQFIEPEYNKDEFFAYDGANGEGIPKLQGVRTQCNYSEEGTCGFMYVKNYEFFSGRIELVSQTEKFYRGQDVVNSGTSYFYQNSQYYYPTKIQASTSESDSVTTLIRYPFDNSLLTEVPSINKVALDSLVLRNVISEPVERTTIRAGLEINRQRTDFMLDGNSVFRNKIWSASAGNPLEEDVRFVAYNAEGGLLEYKGKNDISIGILWGYNSKYPVAQAINAHHDEIYYAGFEETGTLAVLPSNPAHTGERYLNNGTYNFSSNGFVPGSTTNLKMSYWYWSSNKWNFSGIINWSNTISAGTRLDDIRVFPGDSQMTTYTYTPGIGVTSQTDANSVTIYYEYDFFGRLKLIRDKDNNILKKIDYHYK